MAHTDSDIKINTDSDIGTADSGLENLEQALSETLFDSFDNGYYIGMMSGTSLDGMDAVICQFDGDSKDKIVATHSKDFPESLREILLALCHPNGTQSLVQPAPNLILDQQPRSELEWFGWASREYAEFASTVINELLEKSNITEKAVLAIGCHGQTVRHRPQLGFTLQLVDPNIIAERTGISVVTDFRRRDMAVGGQGAPLAPAFHLAQFGSSENPNSKLPNKHRIVVNLGGIANITVLPANDNQKVIGYDTGPANILLDAWYQQYATSVNNKNKDNNLNNLNNLNNDKDHTVADFTPLFDKDGQWAASGQVNDALLAQLLSHPYFAQQTPKSTGREDFHLNWLNEQIEKVSSNNNEINPEDVQATLSVLTAHTLTDAMKAEAERLSMDSGEVIVCGGGAYNSHLLAQIADRLPNWTVLTSNDFGIAPTWVEAMAFAWLARQTIMGEVGNLPDVTGARKSVVLGQVCFA